MLKLFPKSNDKESGVSLLMTIMLVSAITIISVTVAFFIVQNVRESRASALTEPAIIAAETAGEQGLFIIKRGVTFNECDDTGYTNVDGTSAISDTKIKKCLTSLPATFQFSKERPAIFYLFDPDDVNGNLCMEVVTSCPTNPPDGNGTGEQIFEKIIIKHISGSFNIDVAIETLDGVAHLKGPKALDPLTPGATGEYTIDRNILNSNDERMKITLTPTAGSSTVEVSTAGRLTGLPDYQTVDAEGCVSLAANISDCTESAEVYKRRINITLPR